jgi:hypothetical protein
MVTDPISPYLAVQWSVRSRAQGIGAGPRTFLEHNGTLYFTQIP